MIERIRAVVGRLRRLELVVIAGVVTTPIIALLAIAVALLFAAPLTGVLVVLGYVLVVTAVAAIAFGSRLAAARRQVEEQRAAALADRTQPWIDPASRAARERRVRDWAAGLSRRAFHLFGVRTGSAWIRDVYASVLTRDRLDAAGLRSSLLDEAARPGSADAVLAGVPANHLLSYGRMLVAQGLDAVDPDHLAAIQSHLLRSWPALPRQNQEYLAEWLISSGRPADASPIVTSWRNDGLMARMLAADLVNPHAGGAGSEATWLAALNAIFRPHGLDPVLLVGDGSPYDRLDTAVEDRVDGPLVTVIMTCYRPDASLFTAIRSMQRQTWQNWELLLMDDASPGEFDAVLDAAAAMDPRVRLVRAAENAGTYVRRNDAIAMAAGEFVTMHDSDDWVHPRRLEIQARHLVADPDIPGNLTTSLRVTEHLQFVQPRRASLRPAESSLLFRREPVVRRIGYYDPVRRGADSEYRLRMEAAIGASVPVLSTGGPLSLIRYTTASLSGRDFGDGLMHPARVAYRSAMKLWHDEIRAGRADPVLTHPAGGRPFPAPSHITGTAPERTAYDAVVVADLRPRANPAGVLDRLTRELSSLAAAGRAVAVAHVDSLCEDRRLGIAPAGLQRLVNERVIDRVQLEDEVVAETVVVRHASVLQGRPNGPVAIRARRVVVIEDRVSGRDRRDANFVRDAVESTAARMFGGTVSWHRAAEPIDLADLAG